ncbi:MAG: protein kinase, partial [Sandaracinaceae bacterium]|nr:protein kinase [Sandaracinaceae bacterium]
MRCDSCGTDAPPSAYCPACGGARPHAQRDPLVGTMLTERYEIVERLGEGGMGRVYRAIQRGLDRPVALKVIAPERAHAPELSARFVAEARALSKLNHPNIVRVLDFGRATVADGELMFLAMELLSGEDLRAAMHPGELLPVVACADIVVQVLAALAEVHHAGIAHRDIKPDNIRLTSRRDGRHRVKLIDFGVARHAEGSKVTRSGFVVGTPEYMAPEAAMGVAEGPESDLYAAGVVLFELLTGRPLFEGTPVEVLRKQISAPRPDPRSVSKRPLPDALAEVCARAIAIEPERRFPTAHAFAQALLRASAEAGWVTRAGAAFPSIRPARAIDATSTLVPARARATMTVTPVLPLVGRDAVLEELR